MATLLKIDETSGNDAGTQDVGTALPSALVSALDTTLSSTTWQTNGTLLQKSETVGALSNLGSNATDVAFTNADGTPLDGVDSGLLTIDGLKIFLYSSSITNNLVIGRVGTAGGLPNSSGQVVLAFYLETTPSGDANATGANLWVLELNKTLQHYLNTDPANANYNNFDDFVTLSGKLHVTVTNPVNFSLAGAPSGQNLFLMFGDGTPGVDQNGDPAPNEVAIIVTATNAVDQSSGANITSGGTVNTGQGGGGTTLGHTNQMVDPSETLLFSFVQGANVNYTVPNLDQTEADVENNIDFNNFFEASSASFSVVQEQPTKAATLEIHAYQAKLNTHGTVTTSDDTPWEQTDFINQQNDNNSVNIESVTITRSVTVKKVTTTYVLTYNEDGTFSGTATTGNTVTNLSSAPASLALTVTFTGDTVKVKGALAGDNFKYVTSDDHDRVTITNVGDANANFNSAFDIGAFRIESGGTTTNPLGDIQFYDDGPSVSIDLKAGGEARVDESVGQNAGEDESSSLGSVTVTAATLFTESQSFGRDGAASSNSSAYSLKLGATTDSGLDDTASGENVILSKDGNDIVGKTETGGALVFRIAINASTGAVTLTQYRSMEHGNPNDSDESSTPLSIVSGAVFAVHTVMDKDNDQATDDADIGPAMKFEDDGPSVTIDLKAGAEVRVDESLGQNGAPETEGGAAGLGSVTVAAAVLFTENPSYGQDGQAASDPTVYSLRLNAAPGVHPDSGLDDSVTGQSVLLYIDGNDIVGKTATSLEVVFRIAINSSNGAVTLTQYRAMLHGNPNDPDESATPLSIASGLVDAVRTITDGDGDHASDGADIGPAMKFEDDGPNVSIDLKIGAEVRVDESLGQNAGENEVGSLGSVTVSGAVLYTESSGFGQDGAASSNSSVYTLHLNAAPGVNPDSGLDDSATGQNILLYADGNDIVGKTETGGSIVFRIAINASNGAITLTQYRAMVHGNPNDADESATPLSIAAGLVDAVHTVTDKDGDHASDSTDVGPAMKFEDDGPNVSIDLKVGAEVRVDESMGQNGAPETEGGAAGLGQVTVSGAVLYNESSGFGQDGAAASNSNVYSLTLNAAPGVHPDSGLDDSATGQNVLLYIDGNDIVGKTAIDGDIVFRIAVNSANGAVTLTQYRAMLHGNPNDPDEASTPLSIASGLVFVDRTVTDKDGDHASDNADVGPALKFEDDGPNANGTAQTDTVDEDGAPLGGNAGGTGDVNAPSVETGSIAAIFNGGSDGVKTFSLSSLAADINGLPSLTSQGAAVLYNVTGNKLTAYVELSNAHGSGFNALDDRQVFTLELSGTKNADYTFTLLDQLDHAVPDPAGGSVENNLTLNLGSILKVQDNDDDPATAAANKLVITVNDDSPVINGATNLVYANSLNGAGGLGGTGMFDYSIGQDDRDSYSSSSSDLLVSLVSGAVGSGANSAITNRSVTWASETDSQAVFNIAFTYVSNPGTGATTNATGTLTFDKVNDTYKVLLAQPISSFTVLTLRDAAADAFKGYQYDSSTPMGGIAGVTTAQLATNFFVQFKGFAEPSGNGTDGAGINNNGNLDALALGEAWSNPDDDAFTTAVGASSELFTLALPAGQTNPAGVSISGTSAGTNSDTMQSGEVLDFTFYSSDPAGLLNPAAAKTTAGTIFIEFDQLSYTAKDGTGEDMVIVLKLVDASNPNITTTRAIVVDASDIYHSGETLPSGFGFTSAITGNNGLVVIEGQDYNGAGENWIIQGAQVLASTEGVSGSGIDLNKLTGAGGASSGTKAFGGSADSGNATASTWDSDVFKIVNIGFITNVNPDASLNFDVKVVDFDGDTTGTQSLAVKIESDSSWTATNLADIISMRDIPGDLDLTMVAESRTVTGFNPIAPNADLLDFTTDATAANYASGGSFANIGALISAADTALNGTTQYYFATIGSDGYLAYDQDGNGMTALIKLVGVTSNFDHNDIF